MAIFSNNTRVNVHHGYIFLKQAAYLMALLNVFILTKLSIKLLENSYIKET